MYRQILPALTGNPDEAQVKQGVPGARGQRRVVRVNRAAKAARDSRCPRSTTPWAACIPAGLTTQRVLPTPVSPGSRGINRSTGEIT